MDTPSLAVAFYIYEEGSLQKPSPKSRNLPNYDRWPQVRLLQGPNFRSFRDACRPWTVLHILPDYSPDSTCRDEKQKGEASGEKQVVKTEGAYCECGEGYACTITKTEGPDAGKVFVECGNDCKWFQLIARRSVSVDQDGLVSSEKLTTLKKPNLFTTAVQKDVDEKQKGEASGKKQVVKTEGAYCECGEGYACTITKTEGPGAGKVFVECGNGCKCEIPGCDGVAVLKD
ncbi:hypothetical protein Cgig2_014116 [Carnegiea gigantea]|uniref:Uncharacterized protein n=1 Tax=Carnegiea gigantea TaxID=171969 RepID=A0A9Q1KYQ7_9CARY|nr:hypothetical protein Cgig2_014116 [Carnegiea gigantea]